MLEAIAAGVKAILYAAALSAGGSALARATLIGAWSDGEAHMLRIGRRAGAVLVAAAFASAALFVARLGNYWDVPTLSAIFLSPLGFALALYCVAGAWLAAGPMRASGAVAAALIVIAFAVSGHAAARGVLPSAIMAAHVGAAAWWVGSLWLLLAASKSQESAPFAELVKRFSTQAIWIVGGLLVAGGVAAILILNFRVDLSRAYDRGLGLKIGLAALLLMLAAFNKFALTPGLTRNLMAKPALRRSIIGELSMVACILAATASLTTFTSPHEATAPPAEIVAVSGAIEIIAPWAAPTPGGVETGAGYLSIINNQREADSLIGASSPRAGRMSLHEMSMDGAIMRMRSIDRIEISSGQRLDLTTGHYHLMFEDIDAPFVEGETIAVTLTFRRQGDVEVDFPVRRGLGHSH